MLDYTESLWIEFDPEIVSFAALLKAWSQMSYLYAPDKTQYRNAIFFITLEQQDIALAFIQKLEQEEEGGKEIFVDVERARYFYKAEDYHQNYLAPLKKNQPSASEKKKKKADDKGTEQTKRTKPWLQLFQKKKQENGSSKKAEKKQETVSET